jgi:hypothetical protein
MSEDDGQVRVYHEPLVPRSIGVVGRQNSLVQLAASFCCHSFPLESASRPGCSQPFRIVAGSGLDLHPRVDTSS